MAAKHSSTRSAPLRPLAAGQAHALRLRSLGALRQELARGLDFGVVGLHLPGALTHAGTLGKLVHEPSCGAAPAPSRSWPAPSHAIPSAPLFLITRKRARRCQPPTHRRVNGALELSRAGQLRGHAGLDYCEEPQLQCGLE